MSEMMPDVGAYRVLVVDDDRELCEAARRQITSIAGPTKIYVDEAFTSRVASNKVRSCYYDLVLLDLYKERVLAGYEVYRKLNELGCSCDVIFMTRFNLDPSVKTLLQALASGGSTRLVGFIDKRQQAQQSIHSEVAKLYTKFAAAHLNISNLDLASRIISRRRSRYERQGSFPLRQSLPEIDAEVERLLRQLYVEVPPSLTRATEVSVAIEPMDRRGLSAAVVVNAMVEIGFAGTSDVHGGHKTVLKIGPKLDILEEASRFREFVRYGVELDQRVELLGVAAKDSLGALVYSFAGGVYRRNLASLDDVLVSDLRSNRLDLSRAVLEDLFKSRHWYSVRTSDVDVDRYFVENYRNDLMLSCSQGEDALMGLASELGDRTRIEKVEAQRGAEAHFAVSVGAAGTLIIPNSSVLGLGTMYGPLAGCLVHGDMHAGNVMLEISQPEPIAQAPGEVPAAGRLDRACLIDFRNAGPGPRSIDAVALESSVRLADGEAVCRSIDLLGESGLSASSRFRVAQQMAGRVQEEIALYRSVFGESNERPLDGWQSLAAEILLGLRSCFPDVTLREYLGTSIRYTLRQLGFEMEPIARVRLLSWLAAQYSLLMDLPRS
jgi:CheY-like chemotaxis protein